MSKALSDARITYDQVEQAAVGYVYGEGTFSARLLALKMVKWCILQVTRPAAREPFTNPG